MILTHKAKRCKLAYTTTQQFLSQTPLPHEPNTEHFNSSMQQRSSAISVSGTQQHSKKGRGLQDVTHLLHSSSSLPHTNTHQRSQAVHSSKAEWNSSVPLYQQGRLSLEDTNSILSPHYHLNAWEPAPLHTTERAQRQLLAHQSLDLDSDAVKKNCTDTLHLGRSTPHFWSDRLLGAWPHLIEPEFYQDLEDLSMPRPLCLSVLLICFCLKWESLFRCTREAGGRQF